MYGYDFLYFLLSFQWKIKKIKLNLVEKDRETFMCPICNYKGVFVNSKPLAGSGKHAICPKCGSLQRHRLQNLVLQELCKDYDFSQMSILHVAPEPFFRRYFKMHFNNYSSADLSRRDVDYQVDLCKLPFESNSYDFFFASHVLEHIKDDEKAISEICRILKPGGIAILPVPIVAEKTVEYPESNPYESFHVRAPGIDYYEKYKEYFKKVQIFSSNDFSEMYQLYLYEERSCWPKDKMPLRPMMKGDKHLDFVPVCSV